MLEQPTSVPHTSLHTSGTTQPTSSTGGGNTRASRAPLPSLEAPGRLASTWVKDPADHAWQHHEEHGQQLQIATHDAAGLHVGQAASRQTPLDYHLHNNQTPGGGVTICRFT